MKSNNIESPCADGGGGCVFIELHPLDDLLPIFFKVCVNTTLRVDLYVCVTVAYKYTTERILISRLIL